jgi:methionyl-tRNA formyltransferase
VARGVPVIINNWRIGVCEVGEVNLEGDARNIKPGTIVAHDMQNGLIVYCCDGKGLKLEVVYTEEGYLPGYKLGFFGITVGMAFG